MSNISWYKEYDRRKIEVDRKIDTINETILNSIKSGKEINVSKEIKDVETLIKKINIHENYKIELRQNESGRYELTCTLTQGGVLGIGGKSETVVMRSDSKEMGLSEGGVVLNGIEFKLLGEQQAHPWQPMNTAVIVKDTKTGQNKPKTPTYNDMLESLRIAIEEYNASGQTSSGLMIIEGVSVDPVSGRPLTKEDLLRQRNYELDLKPRLEILRDYYKFMAREMYESGLISESAFNEMMKLEHYTPRFFGKHIEVYEKTKPTESGKDKFDDHLLSTM